MMQLYLVRHAPAVPPADPSLDHARPLSVKGRKKFERQVEGMETVGIRFDRILHSPWVRAVQTAELLSPLCDGEPTASEGLAQAPQRKLLQELSGDPLALVGHEPWMGQLLALLTLGDAARGALFPFKKGAVAVAEGEPTPGGCRLVAFYPPGVLRELR